LQKEKEQNNEVCTIRRRIYKLKIVISHELWQNNIAFRDREYISEIDAAKEEEEDDDDDGSLLDCDMLC